MPKRDDLMSTAEVAALFRVDIATINRWAKTGKLAVAVKAPGRNGANLYRRAAVESLHDTEKASA